MIHLFIINPAAGSRDRTKDYSVAIHDICSTRGLEYRIAVSAAPGDCRRIAREAAESGEEYRIYACGGDGTLNEVVSGAAGFSNVAVTVFSGGSGNDFVKLFSEPKAFFHLDRLLDAEEAEFDLIKCNDDFSLNICSVGLDARIGTDVANYKRLPLLSGFRAYAVSTVVNVIRGIAEHYVIEVNGETIDQELTLVCACNGRYYGGGFNPSTTALPDDGALDFVIIKAVSRLTILALIGTYAKGGAKEIPQIILRRGRELKIICREPEMVNLDGERVDLSELSIRLSAKKVNFFFPEGTHYDPARRGMVLEKAKPTHF